MAFIPVPNVALAEIRMTWDAQLCENTLYFEFGSPPDVAALTGLGAALEAWWIDNYKPKANSNVQLREIFMTDLTTDSGPTVSRSPASLVIGDNTSEALPNNVTCSVSFRSGLRGRSFRGRNYFVGLSDDQVSHNTLTSVFIEDIVAAYTALIATAGSVSADWVVVSRFHNKLPRTTGVATPIISVTVVDSTVDSARRRLPGRGV